MTLADQVGWSRSLVIGLVNFALLFAMRFASTKWQGALLGAANLLLTFAALRMIDRWKHTRELTSQAPRTPTSLHAEGQE